MADWIRNAAWLGVFLGLVVFAVPWFLWGDSTVVAGLPIWLWYHVGWLGLTALVFYVFSRRGWGAIVGVKR